MRKSSGGFEFLTDGFAYAIVSCFDSNFEDSIWAALAPLSLDGSRREIDSSGGKRQRTRITRAIAIHFERHDIHRCNFVRHRFRSRQCRGVRRFLRAVLRQARKQQLSDAGYVGRALSRNVRHRRWTNCSIDCSNAHPGRE